MFFICTQSYKIYEQFGNSAIRPINRTLTGTTTPAQNEHGNNDNEELVHTPQTSTIVSYLGLVWFGLVSLLNGISTFVDYWMPKPSF